MVVVKLEGEPAASMKPGQKSCVRSIGIITLLARWPSDGSYVTNLKPIAKEEMSKESNMYTFCIRHGASVVGSRRGTDENLPVPPCM
jgi:hypothetical protein